MFFTLVKVIGEEDNGGDLPRVAEKNFMWDELALAHAQIGIDAEHNEDETPLAWTTSIYRPWEPADKKVNFGLVVQQQTLQCGVWWI